jgi:hypothetical protein
VNEKARTGVLEQVDFHWTYEKTIAVHRPGTEYHYFGLEA